MACKNLQMFFENFDLKQNDIKLKVKNVRTLDINKINIHLVGDIHKQPD